MKSLMQDSKDRKKKKKESIIESKDKDRTKYIPDIIWKD